jgi:hypothetical protein
MGRFYRVPIPGATTVSSLLRVILKQPELEP